MGVFCMILDKRKQYFSLLADIFNITGHKLLIALDEEKALELLKISEPEIIILPAEEIDFWFKLLELGKYIMPVFFLENYEEAHSLEVYGLRDVNFVVLPFNPMELLTKIVSLSKDPQDIASLSALGPLNVLLKLLRKGLTSSLIVQNEESSCTLYIYQGTIKGSSCSIEEFLSLISKELNLKLDFYEESKASINYVYNNNWDFLYNLVHRHALQEPLPKLPSITEEVLTPRSVLDLSQPIEIDKGLFWVGAPQKSGLFQKGSYLRIYEKGNVRIPILINTGAVQDYVLIRSKVEQIVGTVDAIKAVVVLGSGVDECSGILSMFQFNHRVFVITSLSIAQRLRSLGIPQARIKVFESFPDRRLKLATGDILRFIPLTFLPERGSFAMLEEDRGYLFTGRFLSSLCTYEELNPLEGGDLEDVILYTNLTIPWQDAITKVIRQINSEEITSILPMLGNPIRSKAKIRELFYKIEVGALSTIPEVNDNETILQACSNIVKYLKEKVETSKFQAFVEDFSQFAYMEDDRIMEFFVEPGSIPPLMLNLMYVKRIDPAVIKHVIKHLYMAGLPITI